MILLLAGCATPQARGMETLGMGLVGLILSPFMIVAGLAQGIAFLPYTLATGLDELNRGLIEAQAVSLDDAYRATFSVAIRDPRVDQQSGQVTGQSFGFGQHRPQAMLDATHAFQRLLMSQGMPQAKASHYVLLGDYTHTRARGHLLLAVAYRHAGMEPFRVVSKETDIVTTFRPEQQGWRSPYERDVQGQILDDIIDWAGVDYAILQQDKVVAMLMVIAAESVKSGKRSPDYWLAEKRWDAGETRQIIAESSAKVRRALAAR
ncbi:MAG: hypothetical protein U1F68_02350 [Gammaproteobacteria bacterium]